MFYLAIVPHFTARGCARMVAYQGQFECGALRCLERRDLHSYELNFKYKEDGVVKNELVKVSARDQGGCHS